MSLKKSLLDYEKLADEEEKREIRKSIEKSSHFIANISKKLIEVPTPEEIEPDINGYWIKKILWSPGENLSDWISTRWL